MDDIKPTLVPENTLRAQLLLALSWAFRHWYLLLPILLIARSIKRRYFSPLSKYPGPFFASITRLWKVISTARGHTEHDHIAVHRRYGDVVRVAPEELSFARPQAGRDILTAGKGFHKTDFYGVFPPPENPDIFTETREHVHAQKKRVAATPYSMASMLQQSERIDGVIDLLKSKLDAFASTTEASGKRKVLDLGDWLHYFAFDVLGEVAFSRLFGFLEQGYDVEGCIRTIDDSQWYNGIVGQIPFMDHFLRRNPLRQWVPFLSTKNALITRIALSEMEKRRPFDADKEQKGDLLGMLIKGHEKDRDRFREGDVFAVAHGAIFAGSDSTASTMQSFFDEVLRKPEVYKRLQKEVDEATKRGQLSEKVTFQEAQKLEYFQACLKEALRLRPAVGVDIVRFVPPGGADIDGKWYPAGTRVAVNAWVTHRDKQMFGEDADEYNPQRWLESEEKARQMEKYGFWFGGGSHLCIGRNLAILEINKVVPMLLRRYHFELVHPERPMKHHTTFFVVQRGLEVYISKR